jgi:hypothetical protein
VRAQHASPIANVKAGRIKPPGSLLLATAEASSILQRKQINSKPKKKGGIEIPLIVTIDRILSNQELCENAQIVR